MFDLIIFAGNKQADQLQKPVLGVPLIERLVRRLTKCGAERIVLVGDMDGARLRNLSAVSAVSGDMSMSRSLPDFRLIPPKSGTVLFWEADFFADMDLANALVSEATAQNNCVFATSGDSESQTPMAVAVPAEMLPKLDDLRNVSNIANLVNFLSDADPNTRRQKSRPHEVALRIKSAKSIRQMENSLLDELRKPMAVDGFLGALVYRIFSLPISRMIAPFPITPNHVTAVALILGLSGAGAMASGTAIGFLLGALLLQIGAVVDCVDGEIARLKYMGSLDGAWFDTVSDDIVNNSFLLGTGIGLARYHNSLWPLIISGLAVAVILPGISYLYRGLLEQGSGDLCDFNWTSEGSEQAPQTGAWARLGEGVKYLVKRDVYVTLFLCSVLVGVPEFIPVAGLIGAVGFSLTVIKEAQYRRKFHGTDKQSGVRKTQGQPAS